MNFKLLKTIPQVMKTFLPVIILLAFGVVNAHAHQMISRNWRAADHPELICCQDDPTPEEELQKLKQEIEKLKELLTTYVQEREQLEAANKEIMNAGDYITAEGFGMKFGRYLNMEAALAKYSAITERAKNKQELKTERLRIQEASKAWSKMVEEQQATTNRLISSIKSRLNEIDRRVTQIFENFKQHKSTEIYAIDMQEVQAEKAHAYEVYKKIPEILSDMNDTVRVLAGNKYIAKKLAEAEVSD